MIAFIVTKIAVGIFAGGVVFGTLLPEMQITIGGIVVDSFWIGSVLVIVLTGLYTVLGGMRAVAYGDAVQVVILIFGSALLTIYGLIALGGWSELRAIAGSEMFNLWKPLIPVGVESTWAPVIEHNAAGAAGEAGVVLQQRVPVAGHGDLCSGDRAVVLVHGPVYRAARTRRPERKDRTARLHLCSDPETLSGLSLHHPRSDRLCSCEERESPRAGGHLRSGDGQGDRGSAGGIPAAGAASASDRAAWYRGRRPSVGADEFVGRCVQCLLDAVHGGYLRETPSEGDEAELVRMGRIATVVLVVIALAWIPVIKGASGFYNYLQSVQSYLAPPIFVVFFFGVFWKRLNAKGCLWAMIIGFVLGIFRLLVDTPVTLGMKDVYAPGSLLWIVQNINFQYFSILITLVSAVVMVGVSYMTAHPTMRRSRTCRSARGRTSTNWIRPRAGIGVTSSHRPWCLR